MENRDKFVKDKISTIINLLIKGRCNFGIIGEMGSGKTTAADELIIRNLDDDIAIGLSENVHELDISKKYPNKNIIELQYSGGYTPTEIMEIFFRLNRDVVIQGEVRNSTEALEMITAMLRQARGSLFTFHSSSVKRTIHDLRKLLMQSGVYKDYREAQFDVADAINIVLHIKVDRATGKRYVYKIAEVISNEDMSFDVRELFIYQKETDKYLVCREGIHKSTIDQCLEHEMTAQDAVELQKLFEINDDDPDFAYIERG
jgi:pilus assembly protein CpaF